MMVIVIFGRVVGVRSKGLSFGKKCCLTVSKISNNILSIILEYITCHKEKTELLLLGYEFLNAKQISFCFESSGYPVHGILTPASLCILHKPNI